MCFHWLLKIRNWKQPFACFQFPSQIEFWKQFLFSTRFELPNKFFSLKNRKLFLKTENMGKKQLSNIPLSFEYSGWFFFFFGPNILGKFLFWSLNWFCAYFRALRLPHRTFLLMGWRQGPKWKQIFIIRDWSIAKLI